MVNNCRNYFALDEACRSGQKRHVWNTTKTDAAFKDGCRALGEVVYFFQQLEGDLREAVAFLTDPCDGSSVNIVVCELSFKQLINLASSLLPLFAIKEKQKAIKEWREILLAAQKAEEHRNRILHSTFAVSLDEHPVFVRTKRTAKFRKGFQENGECLDPKTMEKYRHEIGNVATRIVDFMGRTFPGWHVRQWSPNRP